MDSTPRNCKEKPIVHKRDISILTGAHWEYSIVCETVYHMYKTDNRLRESCIVVQISLLIRK